jgi:uncharacterized protein YwgA
MENKKKLNNEILEIENEFNEEEKKNKLFSILEDEDSEEENFYKARKNTTQNYKKLIIPIN